MPAKTRKLKSNTWVPLGRFSAYFVPSAFTEALLNVTLTVVPVVNFAFERSFERSLSATHGSVCVIVISKRSLGDHDVVLRCSTTGRSITKLPRAESSVSGNVCGSGVRVVEP